MMSATLASTDVQVATLGVNNSMCASLGFLTVLPVPHSSSCGYLSILSLV
jgi:hypothetical protein